MGRRWIIAGIGLAVCLAVARADTDSLLVSLRPQGYVSDFAGVMRPEDREATERLLAEVERSNGNQIAVVTVRSLDGGQVDDFATRLFERWGIGRKGQNNGILLLAAIEDRKVRIETGYGVEGILPDAATGRLLDQHVLPAFKRGDYSGGLRSGAEALAAVVRSGTAPSAQKETRTLPGGCGILFIIAVILLFIRYPWLLIHILLSGGSSRGGGGGFGGSSFGGFGGGMSGGGGASRGW
jgi:uncharacterized protein